MKCFNKYIKIFISVLMIIILNIFTIFANTSNVIETHDKNNSKYNIGPAEGLNSGNIAIVKYYESEENGEIDVVDYFVSYCENESINILDESEYNHYELVDWFTSTNNYIPTSSGDIFYNKVKQLYNNGPYSGNSSYKIDSNNNNFKVLHILYRFNPSFNKRVNVVKVLEDTAGNIKNITEDKGVLVDNLVYKAESDIGAFTFSEYKITDLLLTKEDINSWESIKSTSFGSTLDIPITDSIYTVILKYVEKDNTNKVITLYENEISRRFSLIDLSKSGVLEAFSRKYRNISNYYCDYEYEEDDSTYECGNSCSKDYKHRGYKYTLSNNIEYDKKFIFDSIISNNSYSGIADNVGGFESDSIFPNLAFILHRQYKDKPTIYPLHNSEEVLNDIIAMGYDVGHIPNNTRLEELIETECVRYWNDTFRTSWVCNVEDTPYGDYECSSHGVRDSWTQESTETYSRDTANLNNNYNNTNNVEIFTYLGESNTGEFNQTSSNSILNIAGVNYGSHLSSVNSNTKYVEFYPYIKMTYQTMDSDIKDIFVTSENISRMKLNNRVEIGVYKENPSQVNLNLESNQWSVHNKIQDALKENGIKDYNSVLPGGSIYTLDKTEDNETLICIRTYQTVIPDGLRDYIATGDIKIESDALNDYNKFQEEARDVIKNYQIVQLVGIGLNESEHEFSNNGTVKQVSGLGRVKDFDGNRLSEDSKYYLKDSSGVDKATLDILNENTDKRIYKVYSDTDGIVYVSRDNEIIATMDKNDKLDKLLSNSEIDILNTKTKAIENYISAIDRNKGTDVTGNTWYNEAFDGIEIICNTWILEIGIDGKRTSVLDIKLCDKADDKRDLYNSEKYRTSQFKLSSKSSSNYALGKADGYIGTLDSMQLRFNGISNLYRSKLFYIPNATVKDLN